jgi:hypothetical protein
MLIGLFFVLANGCSQKDISAQQTSAPEKMAAGPLIVKQSSVVFLRLSQEEYNLLAPVYKYEIIEIVRDFEFYTKKISEILIKNGIDALYTSSKRLIFRDSNGKQWRLSFNSEKYPVAFVLFEKGKKPKICYGIVLEDDILRVVSEYFGINLAKELTTPRRAGRINTARYRDIAMTGAKGEQIMIQFGKRTLKGVPISRQTKVTQDLAKAEISGRKIQGVCPQHFEALND